MGKEDEDSEEEMRTTFIPMNSWLALTRERHIERPCFTRSRRTTYCWTAAINNRSQSVRGSFERRVVVLLLSSHYEPSWYLYPVLPLSVLIQQTRPIPVVTECKEPTISTGTRSNSERIIHSLLFFVNSIPETQPHTLYSERPGAGRGGIFSK